MDLRDYLRLVRRRWQLIALCTLLGVGAAAGATFTQAKVYTAKAQLFVSAQDQASSAGITGAYQGGLFTQQRVKSYVDVITSVRTAGLVRERLQLPDSADSIARQITASAPLDTVLINVSVTDRDPVRAQRIANAVGDTFPGLVDQIEKPVGGGASPVKVSMVQSAQLPEFPTSPRPKLNLALGLLVGLAAGVGGAVLRETLDTTVKAPDVAEEIVGAPLLGAITYDAEAAKKPLVVHVAPNSSRAEAFRQMRTNLQFIDIEHPLKSVVITSSIPGEGKSTTTCNLAITLAQAGVRVVLVEGDLRRPRVADYMGLEGAVGLTSVLLGRAKLEDALQSWGDGNLRVLASGPLPPNPSELLGSAGMSHLLRHLEGSYDLILIDAPPLLPVTDAAVLGTICSGVLMLVRSNSTRREQLARATATVTAVGANILGTVLNMVPTKGPDAYAYGYGYGYGGRYGNNSGGAGRLAREEVSFGAGEWAGRRRGSSAGQPQPEASAARPALDKAVASGGSGGSEPSQRAEPSAQQAETQQREQARPAEQPAPAAVRYDADPPRHPTHEPPQQPPPPQQPTAAPANGQATARDVVPSEPPQGEQSDWWSKLTGGRPAD